MALHLKLRKCNLYALAPVHPAKARCACWQGVNVTGIEVKPQPVHPLLFSERIMGMSAAASKAMHAVLEKEDLVDAAGYLQSDPR